MTRRSRLRTTTAGRGLARPGVKDVVVKKGSTALAPVFCTPSPLPGESPPDTFKRWLLERPPDWVGEWPPKK